MPKAIVIDQPGSPDAMQWRDVAMPELREKELLIRQVAVGLNYIDLYYRNGTIPIARPSTIGLEGAGVVEAVGPGCINGFKPGDKICYAGGPLGAYAQYRALPEDYAIGLPENISLEMAAAVMVKGLTAYMLVRRVFMVDAQATMLVHAAAGGVGLLLCQWGRELGATVIGTVGSEEKAELARQNGATHVINYRSDNVIERVMEITQGRGCNVVYDSIGRETFSASMRCLNPIGLLVSYGESSGQVAPVDLNELQKSGSLFVTRPSFEHYLRDYKEYILGCATLLDLVGRGRLKVNVGQSYYLKDAALAHQDLEARRTTGATIFYTES